MKKKKSKIWVILLLIIMLIQWGIIYALVTKKEQTTQTTTTIKTEKVGLQNIENTITASGEISSSNTEKLTLTTSKYFTTMCVEEKDEVKEGENILQYSNGTYLTAPYDCLIVSFSVPNTGSICTSSNYIEVKTLETLTMNLSIDETEISKVKKGQEVKVTVNALENKSYTGTISKINEMGTYASNGSSFSASITFENDGNIKLGMSASCTVVLEKEENVLAVPIEAIQTKQEEKYVVVVKEDGTTQDTTVETGISNDTYVQILSGLNEGQIIQMIETSTTNTSSGKNSSSSSTKSNMGNRGEMSQGMSSGGQMPSGMPGGMGQ